MDRLSVLCFGGTYGLALACDLARFVVGGPARWYATLTLTALAWVVQTAYLGNIALQTRQLPVSTVFESLLVLSWVLAAVGLYLIVRSPKPVAVGVFVLPVVLALVVVAGAWAPREEWTGSGWGGAGHFWGSAHGLLYLVGAVASCVAFAAGLMYLAQSHRLKHKRPPRFGFRLPSLEESERLNRAAITVAFPFLTAGLLVGVMMEVALRKAGHSRLGWADPKVVSGVLVWLVFAGLLHARFRPEMRGRRVMLFTLVAFLCLAFATVGVDLMHITSHGVPRPKKDSGLGTRDSGRRLVGQGKPCRLGVSAGQALPYGERFLAVFPALSPESSYAFRKVSARFQIPHFRSRIGPSSGIRDLKLDTFFPDSVSVLIRLPFNLCALHSDSRFGIFNSKSGTRAQELKRAYISFSDERGAS